MGNHVGSMDDPIFARDLADGLDSAFARARENRHESFTVEHLLRALLDNPPAAAALRACGCRIDALRKDLQRFLAENTPILPPGSSASTQPTPAFQRAIQRAIFNMQSASRSNRVVTGADVVVAIFDEQDSFASFFLHQQGVSRPGIADVIARGIDEPAEGDRGETRQAAYPHNADASEEEPAYPDVPLAPDLEASVERVLASGRKARHEFITVEHLLLGLLENPFVTGILHRCGSDIPVLRAQLQTFVDDNTPTHTPDSTEDTLPTLGVERVLRRAMLHVQSTGHGEKAVTGAEVLAAIFDEPDSHAVYYLHQQKVTRGDVTR